MAKKRPSKTVKSQNPTWAKRLTKDERAFCSLALKLGFTRSRVLTAQLNSAYDALVVQFSTNMVLAASTTPAKAPRTNRVKPSRKRVRTSR